MSPDGLLRAGTWGSRFVDLSHELADGMAPYPGLPTPRIGPHLDHAASRTHYDGDEFFLGKVDMPTNVGTYVDAPFHRFLGHDDLSQIPLERLTGVEGLVVDATQQPSRGLAPRLPTADVEGAAVLICTGWDSRWGTDAYWEPGPYFSDGFAHRLVDGGVALVGVDFSNVDDHTTRRRPVHTCLLGAGILIVEHLCNLEAAPDEGFSFSAIPPKFKGVGTFPVRALARVW